MIRIYVRSLCVRKRALCLHTNSFYICSHATVFRVLKFRFSCYAIFRRNDRNNRKLRRMARLTNESHGVTISSIPPVVSKAYRDSNATRMTLLGLICTYNLFTP